MDSLYAGQPGISFVLKKAFKSIDEMTTAFAKGPDYKDVFYGEYCIIDTPNKNDRDNGKIYRRGYNYLETPMHGAIKIGNVVGPSSGTPYFQMDSIPEVVKKSKIPLGEYEYRRYPIGKDADGNYITTESTGEIKSFNFSATDATKALVPGKTTSDGKTTYNDDIIYTWVNIRKDNNDADSWFYVGFQIPYLVNDFSVHMVSPYDSNGNATNRLADAVRVPVIGANGKEEVHPYYQHWDFGIPKGIRGDALRNLKVIVPQSGDRIFPLSAITYNSSTGDFVLPDTSASGPANYDGFADDVANQRQILVYEYCFYNNKRDGEVRKIYLGDYNQIKKVALDVNTGNLQIDYTHDNPYKTTLSWVKDVDVTPNGTIVYTKTNGTTAGEKTYDASKVQWVNDIGLRTDSAAKKSYIDFTYNTIDNTGNPNKKSLEVDWITSITVNASNGDVSFGHLNGTVQTVTGLLKTVKSASITDEGVLTFAMNDGKTNITVNDGNTTNPHHFKEVRNVELATNLLDDSRIHITYNYNGSSDKRVPIGNPINSIHRVYVRPSDYHMFVLYSDKSHRATSTGVDSQGRNWVILTDTVVAPYNTSDYKWQDLGAMKDQSGVMVGKNITPADIGGKTVLEYLNTTYPEGLVGSTADGQSLDPLKGKVVTYGVDGKTEKEFYAFDYDDKRWYYLGQVGTSSRLDAKILTTAPTIENVSDVNEGGIVVRVNTYAYSPNNVKVQLPSTWKPTVS